MKSFRCLSLYIGLLLCVGMAGKAVGADMVLVTGRVLGADDRRPLAGAMVAVYDERNRVIDYARTDERGEYALAVPRSALNLNRKSGGFFHQVVRTVAGVGNLAAAPLRFGVRAAASAANAADPLTKVGVGVASSLAQNALTPRSGDRNHRGPADRYLPGNVVMKVSVPGHNDAISVARVYWLQEEVYRAGGKEQRSFAAWIDPATMFRAESDRPSTIGSNYLTFSTARLEPSIAEIGQPVVLSVVLPDPPEPRTPLVVVARNSRTGSMIELTPAGNGVYRAEIAVDRSFPRHDQVYTVLAYAAQDDRSGRDRRAESALEKAGMFDPNRVFIYDPLLVVSRNRAEATLTVVDPRRR